MDIEKDIEFLKKETFDNRLNFSRHEAICQQRYETLLANMTVLTNGLHEIKEKVNKLEIIAESGKLSIRTLLIAGGVVTTILTLIFGFINIYK